ncbi:MULTISPECIES: ABC transporter ATP-binding protein [Dermacoccus]|uniref:ABC transporter ATP-binding protein n=1 Tax=Dermacoccus TaxID=57495 RepID=UPI001F30462A|nr:ABC transporter ATP-binding protein [Dermacoccus nishinomiyaensis]
MSNAAITLTGVTKTFPGKHGRVEDVRGSDLEITPGEVVAFRGPNDAGKTTTTDMILGLSEPTTGSVSVFGMTPHAAVARGLLAAVMQTGGLLEELRVRESVEYVAALFPDARPVDDVLTTAGVADLADLADRRVGKCSGGEQQRVRFAMALVPDPALIVLDEPTTGMDVNARRAFWKPSMPTPRGRTILFATHYLEETDARADRVVVMRDGEIVAGGSSSDIRSRWRQVRDRDIARHGLFAWAVREAATNVIRRRGPRTWTPPSNPPVSVVDDGRGAVVETGSGPGFALIMRAR